ncbi:[protein-PII] uridylyltransferase [Mycobacterium sp.]|uniref:[protein-PII] uridylyltransferase n=1 Tax=Mycobacterium sp. TaxID=1785 RepID=UPI001273986F|nr:[protein-PII] uridylyltransferase [Mycobacterium sp.]KAA8964278.1 MAG: [protein-PII] uridylyltransferase [Mycobacterium sp.]
MRIDLANRSDQLPGSATDLAAVREILLSGASVRPDAAALREKFRELYESWLIAKAAEIGLTEGCGFAIVATGSLGRRELLPYSDLDLLLLHDNAPADIVSQVADLLWYPLWDNNIRLDHSVRTVAETLQVAGADISAGLAMLDARHIAGDAQLSAALITGVRSQWRRGIASRFAELVDVTHSRWRRSSDIAHSAEPDLKCGRGGLRDVRLLGALAVAQLADPLTASGPDHSTPVWLGDAYRTLLDVCTELHRVSGRGHDLLLAQYADEISAALGIGDRYDLAREISSAARSISFAVDAGLRTAADALPRRGILTGRRLRRPLDEGVVESGGQIVLARDARPERDPGLVLRLAASAAVTGLPIAASTLVRVAETASELPTPWPREALDDLLVLLAAGPSAVTTIEALDRTGLWSRLFPEWDAVRDLPPRDSVHIWTVDRHLVETVVRASTLTTRVARPDLLLLAAMLHDIGKGSSGDHSVRGAEAAVAIGTRIGMWPSDVEMLRILVAQHLLLSKVAIRQDLSDPRTVATVSAALGRDPLVLDVLHALTEADALATGPMVWSDWKASLVGDLVRRCRAMMTGQPLPEAEPIDPQYIAMAAAGGVQVRISRGDGPRMHHAVMIAPDQRGLLSKAAAVLALNSLRVHSASVNVHQGVAINEFVVSPHFGSAPPDELLRQQFIGALAGDVDVLDRLRQRDSQDDLAPVGEVPTAVPVHCSPAPPRVFWFDDAPDKLLLEVRATDRPGLLARLAGVLERAGVDIAWAKVTTRGSMVNDVFCVVPHPAAAHALSGLRSVIEHDLLAVLRVPS